jgi:hypothetical protein
LCIFNHNINISSRRYIPFLFIIDIVTHLLMICFGQLQQADKVLYCLLHQRQKDMVSEARAKWGADCAYAMASKIVHEQLRLNDLLEEYSQVFSASDPKVALKHLGILLVLF